MPDTPSESLHESIQRELRAGDFEKVRELSSALGQAIMREASQLALNERSAFIEKGLSRLGEHISFARVLRAHVASQLQENTTVCLYQPSGGDAHSWRFDA